jgi:WD40 repeat protein
LAWSPDDKTLAVSCGPELKVKLVPMDEKAPVRSLEDPEAVKEGNTDMCWSPDGKTLAAVEYWNAKLKVWDIASGKGRLLPEKVVYGRDLLCWLDEGKTLVSYCERGNSPIDGVTVWDVAQGKLLRCFSTDGEVSLSFAPRKGLFAVAGPGAIRLRSLADGEVLRTVAYLRNKRQLSVSPEGHWRGSPGVESELRYLVLTDSGQDMLTPAEFEKKYGWKNDPQKVILDLEAGTRKAESETANKPPATADQKKP